MPHFVHFQIYRVDTLYTVVPCYYDHQNLENLGRNLKGSLYQGTRVFQLLNLPPPTHIHHQNVA